MYRIDDPSASATLPTPEAALTEGYWTEGNPGTGTPATLERASWFNMIQEELRAIVVAGGLTPSKTTYNQVLSAMLKIAGGSYEVHGLAAQNNSTTPSTQFDIKADLAVFRNPATGATTTVPNVATVTNNISTAGPAANGRDVSGAFSASSFVHFYLIYNGTTVATLSSASAPPTGPALPTGYTSWAYVGSALLTSGTVLNAMHIRGSWVTYDTPQTVLSGTAVVSTPFSTAALVPANALSYRPLVQNIALSAASNSYSVTLFIDSYQVGFSGSTFTATGVASISGGVCELPNLANTSNYRISLSTGSGPTVTVQVHGYKVPNGGE
jgi:hypothetical protein